MGINAAAKNHSLFSLWKRHPFHLHIAVLFTTMVFLVGVLLAWSNFSQGRQVVLSAAEEVFHRIEREIIHEYSYMRMPVEAIVSSLSRGSITKAATFNDRIRSLEGMADALNRYPMLESIYTGYYNGDFFQLHALRNDADRKRFDAPRQAAYRLQSIERDKRQVRFLLLDPAMNDIKNLPVPPDYPYDPRERPWYSEAIRTSDPVQTAPYVFFTTQETGQTIARRADHGRAVVGADITLKQLSETLAKARPSPSSQLALFDSGRNVIALSEDGRLKASEAEGRPSESKQVLSPVLAAAMKASLTQTEGNAIVVDGREWLIQVAPIIQTAAGLNYLAVVTPIDELLTGPRAMLKRNLWLALALILLTAPFTWWMARLVSANLNALTEQAAAIRRFNFAKPSPISTRIIEIEELGEAMARMRSTIREFMDITTALSVERSHEMLLRRLLTEAQSTAGSDGGVIYLFDKDRRVLKDADQHWNRSAETEAVNLPRLSVQEVDNPVVHAALTTTKPDVYPLAPERPAGLEYLDGHFGRIPLILLTVPLFDRSGDPIGVLCLFQQGSALPPSPEQLALVQAFASAGAVAIGSQRLLSSQKALINS